MADNEELTDEEIGLIACFCWSKSKELLNKEKHDMLNDEEFTKLEERYFEEKEKRQELQKISGYKDYLVGVLDTLKEAKDNPYAAICDMRVNGSISYSDCEGRREISRDYISIELNYNQFVNIIKSELEKTNKEIKAKKEALGLK